MNELDELKTYMDAEGRIITWPTKRKKRHQQLILEYLATKFEPGRTYTENEINTILNQYHTFEDWAMLRREMFEKGLLNRTKDGSSYWRTPKTKLY